MTKSLHKTARAQADLTLAIVPKSPLKNSLSVTTETAHAPPVSYIRAFLSGYSRGKGLEKDKIFHGEQEWLFQYCQSIEKSTHHDYYVFGHRHYPKIMEVSDNSQYINLGDWIQHFTYAVWDEEGVKILK
jgi:UDP-2,3-diacylglucosamine pyrophosphatase LpxH